MTFKTSEDRKVIVTCISACDRCGFTVTETFESGEGKRSGSIPRYWSQTVNNVYCMGSTGTGCLAMTTLCCPTCTATELKLLSYWRVNMHVEEQHKAAIHEQDAAIETLIARYGKIGT